MRQMAFRGIDPTLEARLRAESRRRGVSLNRAVLDLLRKAVGIPRPDSEAVPSGGFNDLDDLIGKWTKKDARAFDKALVDQRKIDPEIWK